VALLPIPIENAVLKLINYIPYVLHPVRQICIPYPNGSKMAGTVKEKQPGLMYLKPVGIDCKLLK